MSQRRRSRRRGSWAGFIVIAGWGVIAPRHGPSRQLTCPECKQETRFVGRLRRTWFTMFFIPVYPLDAVEEGEHICQCTGCRTTFEYSLDQMARKSRAAGAANWQDAIALYNLLRDNPADSATLLKLLETYESMGEPAEAVSAASHFPQAFQASEPCRRALERIRASTPAA